MNAKAFKSHKSVLQIVLLVLGSIAGMVLGGILVAVTLMASPIITVLILSFLAIYGVVLAVTSGSSDQGKKAQGE